MRVLSYSCHIDVSLLVQGKSGLTYFIAETVGSTVWDRVLFCGVFWVKVVLSSSVTTYVGSQFLASMQSSCWVSKPCLSGDACLI